MALNCCNQQISAGLTVPVEKYSFTSLEHRPNLPHQLWQVTNDNLPDQIQLYAEVVMDEDIPHTCHQLPGNVVVVVLELDTELPGSFTNDFDIPNDSVLSL